MALCSLRSNSVTSVLLVTRCHPARLTATSPPRPLTLAPSSALTPKPGSGILGTFFHVKRRGSAQGCDATALFPLRGEEPCAVRPIPVRRKKTATFSHRFPSSARQLKTIPECFVGTRQRGAGGQKTSGGGAGWAEKCEEEEGEEEE